MAKPRDTRFLEDTLDHLDGWTPDGTPMVIPFDDEDSLEDAIRAAVTITRWIGGSVTIANYRKEIAPQTYVPGEYIWSWQSFFPTQTLEEDEQEPEQEPAEVA